MQHPFILQVYDIYSETLNCVKQIKEAILVDLSQRHTLTDELIKQQPDVISWLRVFTELRNNDTDLAFINAAFCLKTRCHRSAQADMSKALGLELKNKELERRRSLANIFFSVQYIHKMFKQSIIDVFKRNNLSYLFTGIENYEMWIPDFLLTLRDDIAKKHPNLKKLCEECSRKCEQISTKIASLKQQVSEKVEVRMTTHYLEADLLKLLDIELQSSSCKEECSHFIHLYTLVADEKYIPLLTKYIETLAAKIKNLKQSEELAKQLLISRQALRSCMFANPVYEENPKLKLMEKNYDLLREFLLQQTAATAQNASTPGRTAT